MQAAYATAATKIAALRTHLSAPADVLHTAGFEQHSKLLTAFRAGDLVAFEKIMRAHITGTRKNYVAKLKARTGT